MSGNAYLYEIGIDFYFENGPMIECKKCHLKWRPKYVEESKMPGYPELPVRTRYKRGTFRCKNGCNKGVKPYAKKPEASP